MWRQPDVKHWGQSQRNRLFKIYRFSFPLRNQARKRLIKCCPNEMADSRSEVSAWFTEYSLFDEGLDGTMA